MNHSSFMNRMMAGLCVTSAISMTMLAGCTDGSSESPKASAVSWKNGVFYEIFVRSFYDSNGDGIGDIRGIVEKLDYLNDGNPDTTDDLGVDGIWLMPIYPSPTYHGYDVTDYYNVNPEYGTLDDIRLLTEEAHKRGMKVILDLPINNTSNEHPWFLEAAADKNSKYRNWYVWAEDQGISTDTVGVFNTNPWHEINGSHYLGIYYFTMPDLNYDHPEVREEMIRIGKFWLDLGVDGFRLDSAKHLYERFHDSRKKPETWEKNVAWWQEFRKGLAEVKPDVYLVGEIWDNNSVIARFLDNALDSGFNFDLAKKLVNAAAAEYTDNIGVWLKRVHDRYETTSGGKFVDAPFLTNHDQDRVMSALRENVDHAKTAAAMLLTLPGNPFLYYGEEIGMLGSGKHEHIREPMVWYKGGRRGPGQTFWETPVFNGVKPPSVEEQNGTEGSLLEHYKMLIRWRKGVEALNSGAIEAYEYENPRVAAYIRSTEKERVLVAHNLSGKEQVLALTSDGEGAENRFSEVVLRSADGVRVEEGGLLLPPYSSAVLK